MKSTQDEECNNTGEGKGSFKLLKNLALELSWDCSQWIFTLYFNFLNFFLLLKADGKQRESNQQNYSQAKLQNSPDIGFSDWECFLLSENNDSFF